MFVKSCEPCKRRAAAPIALAALVLVLGAAMPTNAYGQAAVSVSMLQNGGANLTVGGPFNGVIAIDNSHQNGLEETINTDPIQVIPACRDQLGSNDVCTNPDGGVINITSAATTAGCVDGGGTPVTWTVTETAPGSGVFDFDQSAAIVLGAPAVGPECQITYTFNVLQLPTVDSRPGVVGLQSDAGTGDIGVVDVNGATGGGTGTTFNTYDFTCDVTIEKQVSCAGGEFGEDCQGLSAIAGLSGDDVQVRYTVGVGNTTPGLTIDNCTITESNTEFPGVAGPFSLPSDAFLSPVEECSDTLDNLEENTAEITCDCRAGDMVLQQVVDDDTANFTCYDCAGQIDKQVSCNDEDYVDVSFADDGVNSCFSWAEGDQGPAESLNIQWVTADTTDADNAAEISNCEITETNGYALGRADGGTESALMRSISLGDTLLFDGECNDGLLAAEGANRQNTAQLACDCATPDGSSVREAALLDQDTAGFDCLSPQLNITKECFEQDGITNNVQVSASNPGTATLINCEIGDEVYRDAVNCGDPGAGEELLLSPDINPFSLSPEGTTGLLLSSVDDLTQDSCNRATVTCQISSTDSVNGDPVLIPGTQDPKTLSASFEDICEVTDKECLTRTGGFWSTHDIVANLVIEQASEDLTVCGMPIDSHDDVAEYTCINGVKADDQDTTMQVLQLKRQCTAAVMNIEASAQGGGSCTAEGTINEEMVDIINQCCSAPEEGVDSMCSGDDIEGCIELIADFNESEDTLDTYGPFISPGPANPQACQDARPKGKGKKK